MLLFSPNTVKCQALASTTGMGFGRFARGGTHRGQRNTGPPCSPYSTSTEDAHAYTQQDSTSEQSADWRLLTDNRTLGQHKLAAPQRRSQVDLQRPDVAYRLPTPVVLSPRLDCSVA